MKIIKKYFFLMVCIFLITNCFSQKFTTFFIDSLIFVYNNEVVYSDSVKGIFFIEDGKNTAITVFHNDKFKIVKEFKYDTVKFNYSTKSHAVYSENIRVNDILNNQDVELCCKMRYDTSYCYFERIKHKLYFGCDNPNSYILIITRIANMTPIDTSNYKYSYFEGLWVSQEDNVEIISNFHKNLRNDTSVVLYKDGSYLNAIYKNDTLIGTTDNFKMLRGYLIPSVIECGANFELTQNIEYYRIEYELYEKLIYKHNKIYQFQRALNKNKTIICLKLKASELDDFYANIAIFKNLEYISLNIDQNINLDDFFLQIKNIHSLKELVINGNFKTLQIPKSIGDLKNLTYLNISDLFIGQLPNEINNLTNLSILILYNDSLISLPQSIGALKKLKMFELNYNKLNELPSEFSNLESLAYIDLTGNNFCNFPIQILNLKDLQSIYFSSNPKLNVIPEEINSLKKLKTLVLVQNSIEHIPNSLYEMKNLEDVRLDFNNIPKEELKRFENNMKKSS